MTLNYTVRVMSTRKISPQMKVTTGNTDPHQGDQLQKNTFYVKGKFYISFVTENNGVSISPTAPPPALADSGYSL